MAKANYRQIALRRRHLLELLLNNELSMDDILHQLPGHPSRRTMSDDLRWLQNILPHQLIRRRHHSGVYWSLKGPLPQVLDEPLTVLTNEQVLACIAARSLLRLPDANVPQLEKSSHHSGLSLAIDQLIMSCGLAETVSHIAPTMIMASRHGIPNEPAHYFLQLVGAIVHQQAVTFSYDNNRNEQKIVHTQPQRLVSIHGSWHCFSWSPDTAIPPGRIKQYRLSKMSVLQITTQRVPGLPIHIPASLIDDCLAESFGATGSTRVADRKRIILAVSPDGWPYLRDCTWGSRQTWDETPADLPSGYKRLSFTTTGLPEARHKILSLGSTVTAEGPPELIAWLQEQARALLAQTQSQSATHIANTRAKRMRHDSNTPHD